jgi:hypothetical protein
MTVQMIVTQLSTDRVWDSIRDKEEQAAMKIAEYMLKDKDPAIVAVGEMIKWKLIFGKPVIPVLESQGFNVQLRYN